MTARELVKVKPLEWEPDGDAFEARDVFGEHYRVERDGGLGWYVNHTALINDGDLRETFAEAQADGQDDFTARILSPLDLSAVEALEAELVAAREEIGRLHSILGRIKDETLTGTSWGLGDRIYDLACVGLLTETTDGQ
jgi:hypothetical protein